MINVADVARIFDLMLSLQEIFATHGSEVSVEVSLLQTRPDSDGDHQQLVLVLQVSEGGQQQLNSGQLLIVPLSLVLTKPGERINKDSDDSSSCQGASQEDTGDDVDLSSVNLEVVFRSIISSVGRWSWSNIIGTIVGTTVNNVVISQFT